MATAVATLATFHLYCNDRARAFYSLNVRLRVKADRREEFLSSLRANRDATIGNEPLAVSYIFGEDENELNTFHLHEQYKGEEGFAAHKASEHFQVWKKFMETDPFTEPPEAYKFVEHGEPKEIAAPGDPRYCLNVKMGIKPELRDEFLDCINNNRRGTLDTEPLAVAYLFGEEQGKDNVWHFHEQYKGREGFEAHAKAPHFAVWERFAESNPFTEPPEVVFFTEVQ